MLAERLQPKPLTVPLIQMPAGQGRPDAPDAFRCTDGPSTRCPYSRYAPSFACHAVGVPVQLECMPLTSNDARFRKNVPMTFPLVSNFPLISHETLMFLRSVESGRASSAERENESSARTDRREHRPTITLRSSGAGAAHSPSAATRSTIESSGTTGRAKASRYPSSGFGSGARASSSRSRSSRSTSQRSRRA
jgi:hypothetical protein